MPTVDGLFFPTTPKPFQLAAWRQTCSMRAAALLMDLGTGKTLTALMTVAWLTAHRRLDITIVVAPTSVTRNWSDRQIPVHLPDAAVFLVPSGLEHAKYQKLADTILDCPRRPRIVIIGYGSCSVRNGPWLVAQALLKAFPTSLLIVDESHFLKAPGRARTRAVIALAKLATYRRILTGTPSTKGLVDLYSQFYLLNPGIIGVRTFTEFKSKYCVMGGYENREIIRYQHVEDLLSKVNTVSFILKKSDAALDLPPVTVERIPIELSAAQRSTYRTAVEDLLISLPERDIDLGHHLTKLLRLRQITAGFVSDLDQKQPSQAPPTPTPQIWTFPEDPKATAVSELLAGIGDQSAIVWVMFLAEIDMYKKRFGDDAFYLDGRVPMAERQRILDRYAAGERRILVATAAAAGIGVDITAASIAIWVTHPWAWDVRYQADGRLDRIGQKLPVTVYELEAVGTVDRRVLDVLAAKGDMAKLVMDRSSLRNLLLGTRSED